MKKIVGYFHVCQLGEWVKSFDLIFDCLRKSGLYETTNEIRLGVVCPDKKIIQDYRLEYDKVKICVVDIPQQYERPTLLSMSRMSEEEDETLYWYVHTKGIRHFGLPQEDNVIDWIKLMLYWNVERWEDAVRSLDKYETYGCNWNCGPTGCHYSGNFWWAKSEHVRKLPKSIPENYNGPEDWVTIKKEKAYCPFSSGLQGFGHYYNRYPESNYRLISTKDDQESILRYSQDQNEN